MALPRLFPIGFSLTRWLLSFLGGIINIVLGIILVPGTLLAVHFHENPEDIPTPVKKAFSAYQDTE